jgi:uncharacterized protein YqeY
MSANLTNSKQQDDSTDYLRSLIKKCPDIPAEIGEAQFTRVIERKIDQPFLQLFTENGQESLSPTMQQRLDVLSAYLDQTLICVMIRLPGVSYTIEIDPKEDRLVHWEWHPA